MLLVVTNAMFLFAYLALNPSTPFLTLPNCVQMSRRILTRTEMSERRKHQYFNIINNGIMNK